MKNIFKKFLTNTKNRKLTIGNQNEFKGIIAPVNPIAVVDEPVVFSSDVDFTNANVTGINTDTSNLWSLDGNAATSEDFIGTTTNTSLVFKTNNTNVAVFPVVTGQSIVIGKEAASNSSLNVVVGNSSNTNNNGTSNVLVGSGIQSLVVGTNTGNSGFNTITGFEAGKKLRSSFNVFSGCRAGKEIKENSENNVILGYETANLTANPVNIFTSASSYDPNWNSIAFNSWETTGAVTGPVTTNSYNPQTIIESLRYRISVTRTVNAGTLTIKSLTGTGTNLISTVSTSGTSGFNFTASGFLEIKFEPSNDFSGSFSFVVTHRDIDAISNSVIIGTEVKPKDNKDTNEIAIGYQVEGNGSNTVTLGNNSITDTYLKGALQLPTYGDGTVTGTPTRLLAVNTDGKVIETPLVSPRPYTVYTANLSQTGTNNPTTTIFENSLGNVVWTRVSGVDLEDNPFTYFEGTLTGAFVTDKTLVALLNKGTSTGPTSIQVINNNVIRVFTNNADDVLANTSIEIRVYS